jgi:hypothetical protein
LITAADLKSQTVKDLSAMAKRMGLTGVHAMRKDQLVRALVKAAKAKPASSKRTSTSKKKKATVERRGSTTKATTKASAANSNNLRRPAGSTKTSTTKVTAKAKPTNRRIRKANAERQRLKDLSLATTAQKNGKANKPVKKTPRPPMPEPGKDRIILLVRDSYWLQACWEVTRQAVQRARAAMAEHWHTAKPILRLIQVESGATTSSSERVAREIPIHGGVKNWYIDIDDSPKSFRVDLGYLADNGRFHTISRSNTVTTPSPGSADAIDENWTDIAENYEKVFAMSGGYSSDSGDLQDMFEERLRRPMGSPVVAKFGVGAERLLNRERDFHFSVEAEMIIFGTTKADAHVTLSGEPVRLRPDGTFTVRLSMPDRRQVLPVVASSRDGVEQRTIVLAIERNTKIMEPMVHEPHD